MTTAALYQERVLEHSRNPRNFGDLSAHTHMADGNNPLCGDALHVELRLEDARIVEIRFRGEACAIVRATASLLSERILNREATEVAALESLFVAVVNGDAGYDEALGDLNALATLSKYPSRRKCALLPFSTLRAALAGVARITTEGKPQ